MDKFKRYLGIFLIVLCLAPLSVILKAGLDKTPKKEGELHEALFWEALENGQVQCHLCPNQCILAEGEKGLCKVRQNWEGRLYSLVYGRPVAIHVDPIEKKPFYHFLPSAKSYSLATVGCNLSCKFCQNWDISQRSPEDVQAYDLTPEQVVDQALEAKAQVIAFTYNEPAVWYEYMFDIAQLAKAKGLRTVLVSAGYINPEPFKKLLEVLDAARIDLKGFNNDYYQEIVGGRLEPVLESLKIAYQSDAWLEIINLIVPGYNDDEEKIREMCHWIKDNLSDEVPLHFTRFHPQYKMQNLPPTPMETLKKAKQICTDLGLKYIYLGNVEEAEGGTTFCPDNGKALIIRKGFFVMENKLDQSGRSNECPSIIPGVWQ